MDTQISSQIEQNIQKINEAIYLLKTGMPVSVVAKVIGLPASMIKHIA